MPSQSHRDNLPAHYYRVQFLRRMAAAVIRSAERRGDAVPRRPGIRATAPVERRRPAAPADSPEVARPAPRALPQSPYRTNDETERSAERLREQLRRTEF